MQRHIATFVLAALTLNFFPAPVAAQDYSIDPSRYGALAYTPQTG